MASGLFKAGVDLDTLFMARVNAKRADVGIRVAGVDISNRYETIGGASPIAATNFKSVGVDLASLFRNISAPLTTHAMVSGDYDTGAGAYYVGFYGVLAMGSLTPGTFGGYTINYMMDLYQAGADGFYLFIQGAHPQNFFTSLQINGHTFLSSAATYSSSSGTEWKWLGVLADLGAGGSYPVAMF